MARSRSKQATTTEPSTITRDDLQHTFQSFQDGVTGKLRDRRQSLLAGVGIVGLLVVLVIFALGRRSGRKRTTLVEIRRL